ncbi:hypothetical protein [Desulfovibrio sp. ZJ200]|uniref:hypothetical protein n=1 Tax=Desulfovibrio sp. ZJ200 TaxID=2709792 RepID=UPI001F149F2C|nr:hypothetical protein [Desulfovibrio sp. ZJ200]
MELSGIQAPVQQIVHSQPFQKRRDRFHTLTDAFQPQRMQDKRIEPCRQRNGTCPEGEIHPAESGGQDCRQHKIFETSRRRVRGMASFGFSSPQEAAGDAPDTVQRRPHRAEPATEKASTQYGKQNGERRRKKRGNNGAESQRDSRTDKGLKPQKNVWGQTEKGAAFSRSQQQGEKNQAGSLYISSQCAAHKKFPFARASELLLLKLNKFKSKLL